MTLDARTQALLDLVEADRDRRCREVLETAQRRAAATIRQAHEEARARMHEAFTEERARTGARIASAQANLQTRRRLDLQQRTAALLAAGWRMLPDALQERWRDPVHRAAWVEGIVAAARASLPHAHWRITHPADWPATERDALAAALTEALGAAPEMIASEALRAGLRVAADGNVVDGTLEGLTADRDETGARLLHHLEQGASGS
jgi:hypothetical protein